MKHSWKRDRSWTYEGKYNWICTRCKVVVASGAFVDPLIDEPNPVAMKRSGANEDCDVEVVKLVLDI